MGKTALAMTIGLNMAADYSVAMLSMEMPHVELNDRMTAMLGRVSLSSVKRPNRGDGLDWGRVVDGMEKAKRLNFYASDQGGLNINQVRSKARNIKRLHGLNVLVVDYIGLMSGTDARQPRAYQLEEISRGLKTLAKELEIAVICLAQVNRKVEERADSTPSLSDLRDSGAIEQDADVVLFVHRPIQARPDCGSEFLNYAKLSVSKNRNGRCGVLSLFYQGNQTRFDSWSGPAPSTRTAGRQGSGL
jgi:replicative DNA helicase